MIKTRTLVSVFAAAAISVFSLVFFANQSNAVTASDWRAGNIVDDFAFTNSDDMTVADIQAFLNSVNPNCDTYGTGRAVEKGRGDITRAQYAALRGWAGPPYVCLKDYYEVPVHFLLVPAYLLEPLFSVCRYIFGKMFQVISP